MHIRNDVNEVEVRDTLKNQASSVNNPSETVRTTNVVTIQCNYGWKVHGSWESVLLWNSKPLSVLEFLKVKRIA